MSELLGLEHVGLVPDGPTLTLSVARGQMVSICGPGAAGKTRLLRIVAGLERPSQGLVRGRGAVLLAEPGTLSRRARISSLARKGLRGVSDPTATTEVLLATRLWDARRASVGELTPSQLAACELIGPLMNPADLIVLDGQLDRLDVWTLRSVLERIASLRHQGCSFVIATNRADLIGLCDAVVVLKDHRVRFAGTIDDLLRIGPPHTLQVATENRPGVQALTAPFEVTVKETPEGVRLEAAEGQSLAARLLLEGYGDVRFIVVRPPTIEEALLSLH